jgi:deoxyadenosine/deoxycytidine kinase|tara:strand:+ start:717 stop:1340 length:624 start_codon:yes stop_codon:yes gene_type:complete
MVIITIDGNIGCGKTGVLNFLHKNYKYAIDLEPVDNWQKHLNKIYNKEKDEYLKLTNIFDFQVRIWLDRCWIQSKIEANVILVERSPSFIRNVFIKNAINSEHITYSESEILDYLHKKTDYLWQNNIYIYLQSNPTSCLARIKKRNRISEDKITIEYLEKIDNLHEIHYDNMKINKTEIYIINVENKTIQMIANEVNDIVKKLYIKH